MSRASSALLPAVLAVACVAEVPPPPPSPLPVEAALRRLPGGGFALGFGISGVTRELLFGAGAGLTLLTPATARELGCQPWGRFVLFDTSGSSRRLERCGDLSLEIGALPLSAPAAVLDPVPAGLEEAGLGGIASLQTFGANAVTLDMLRGRLVVESEATLTRRVAGMRPIEARVGREAGGSALRLFLAVGTPRGSLWMLAGGGSEGRVALAPHALELLGLAPETAPGTPLEVSLDLPGLGRLERPAVVAEGPWDGVLDSATLEQLVLSVDLRDGRAWARRPTAPPE
jgi:hypothetical protein